MKNVINEIDKEFQRTREEYPDSGYVYFTCQHGIYLFDCYYNRKGDKEIVVINGKHQDRLYPNLEEFLTANTLDWDDIELEPELSEWELNGFRDETDYINYRYK